MELNIDQEFWNDFVLEAVEHLDDIEANVISLEQDPENMEIIHTMFRAFHTIKGLSGFVEHTVIQEIAHKTETMMDLCRKQELKVNKDIVDAILKSADFIKNLCEDIDIVKNENYISDIGLHTEVLERLSNTVESDSSPQAEVEVHENTECEHPEVVVEVESNNEPEAIVEVAVMVEQELPSEEVKPAEEQVVKPEESSLEALLSEDLSCIQIEEVKEEPQEQQISEGISVLETPVTVVKIKETANAAQESKVSQATATIEREALTNEPPQVQLASKKAPTPAGEEHMKVANSKIDHLVEMIGELVINQSLLEQHIATSYANDNQLISGMSSFLGITRELQYLSMSLRMVSLKPTFQKISRIARDTIQELSKNVEFVTSGEATEIDRVVTDKLLDPLVHLVKNAISHGVEENEEDRIKNNKPAKARVEINAYNKRGKIYIEVKDNGRGINTEVVYAKAAEKGLIDPNHTYSEDEIKEFIMLPGFSTAKVVDNISGRGVGMDVVKTQILRIGGKVTIQSELNVGSTFTLEVPVNHAIMNGTIVDIQGQHFIIPTMNVKEILQPLDSQWITTQQRKTMIRVRDDIITIVPLSLLFKDYSHDENAKLVMLLEIDQELRALPITNVVNRQEVVVKPVGPEFANLKYISGMSILGNGKVSLILDIDYLFKKEGTE